MRPRHDQLDGVEDACCGDTAANNDSLARRQSLNIIIHDPLGACRDTAWCLRYKFGRRLAIEASG
jgi:hypothetical protein